MTDEIDYEALDPGIRETVRLIRAWDFDTTDSGDGRTKFPHGAEGEGSCECAMPWPNVAIECEASKLVEEADRLCSLLRSIGLTVSTLAGNEEDGHVEIQASYDPSDGSAAILLMFLDDEKLFKTHKAHAS